MMRILLLLFLSILAYPLSAQQFSVSGKVEDAQTKEVLPGAIVLYGKNEGAIEHAQKNRCLADIFISNISAQFQDPTADSRLINERTKVQIMRLYIFHEIAVKISPLFRHPERGRWQKYA